MKGVEAGGPALVASPASADVSPSEMIVGMIVAPAASETTRSATAGTAPLYVESGAPKDACAISRSATAGRAEASRLRVTRRRVMTRTSTRMTSGTTTRLTEATAAAVIIMLTDVRPRVRPLVVTMTRGPPGRTTVIDAPVPVRGVSP